MNGDVTIWDEFGYLGHSTNITSNEFYALETKTTIDTFTQDHMRRILTVDVGRMGSGRIK